MGIMRPEYGEEESLRQQTEREQERTDHVRPEDRADAPEREVAESAREDREVEYLDPESNELRAPGQVCGVCGAVIAAGQDVRRRPDGSWMHEVCPVDFSSVATGEQGPA